MKHLIFIGIFLLTAVLTVKSQSAKDDYPVQPVPFTSVHLNDDFWAPRIRINQEVTIPIALHQCYITGRVDNFKKAGKLIPGYFNTEYPFDDTDIYKIIEGMSCSIQMFPNPLLEARMDSLILYIQKAQESDGYLFTARTAAAPDKMHPWLGEKRWEKDPELSHELYNCGHLYEAAAAHYQATGKRSLLDVAIKSADLLVEDFGPGKLAFEPGHQIVEMGLVKLYRITGKKEYLNLAKFFLDIRGHGKSGEYSQTHKPVVEQDEAVGHAVRATYMYSGMADVAALTGDKSYLNAIDKIWTNVAEKKYYITGGIGATGSGEAFGENYELPNMSAYCETCAAIGNVYWNHRLFLLHGEAKYYDILERTLYNGVLSGISLAGDRFFYPNPLESVGQHSRSQWFGCACCPSNICRFIPSVAGYFYAQKDRQIYINLFARSETEILMGKNRIKLSQQADYPREGNVTITVSPQKKEQFDILVRLPGWARNKPAPGNLYTVSNPSTGNPVIIKINGKEIVYNEKNGYAVLSRKWEKGDGISILFPMNIQRITADNRVKDDAGKIALQRGPLVYCLEGADNDDKVLNSVLGDNAAVTDTFIPDKLNGIRQLQASGQSAKRTADNEIIIEEKTLTAIPYYAWANRGQGEMMVWIPRSEQTTRPLPPKTICTEATVTASTPNKSLSSVNDGYSPEHSNDRKIPFFSLWPKNNAEEWICYTFDKPQTVSRASVYWFDDAPWGGCRIPLWWKVQYRDGDEWKDVRTNDAPKPEKDAPNTITFQPVITSAVRLLFLMPEDKSSAVYEFEVLSPP
ncbi:MAG: glycoside hydrolase family 127 protein [Bacteroidales bacterium]|jgi:DUF1680 family protein|nr:glycoside hydrolase family 127 protein [Bacteroidales bacterium]